MRLEGELREWAKERKEKERKYVGKKELSTAVILVAEGYYDSKGPDRSSKLGRSPWWVAVPSFMQGRDQNGCVKKHPVRWQARRMNALLRRRIKKSTWIVLITARDFARMYRIIRFISVL